MVVLFTGEKPSKVPGDGLCAAQESEYQTEIEWQRLLWGISEGAD